MWPRRRRPSRSAPAPKWAATTRAFAAAAKNTNKAAEGTGSRAKPLMSDPGETTSDGSVRSDRSDRSHSPAESPAGIPAQKGIRPSGGYRKLRSFQATTIIYDATVSFCARFVDKHSRTTDQMVQAARSGRQNIAEGSRASATSSQTELRLVNVARASLD